MVCSKFNGHCSDNFDILIKIDEVLDWPFGPHILHVGQTRFHVSVYMNEKTNLNTTNSGSRIQQVHIKAIQYNY